ncbi:hypothetical protein Zmor_023510 [Zophobas morio]|uniref:SET domain-containing protein n=1 Tax=Zophobas morio TaxID=2755281 RepID=A0AA38HYD4_9CUCU|nr:hypothetical protein Zmor_023510 [Zophobas morio]
MGENSCLYKITENDQLGRYIIAAKIIKQGQLILKENPVILCPQIGGCTICFNCCAQIKKVQFCSECAVAVLCNSECKGQFHTPQECSVIKKTPIKREDLLTNPEIVTPFRYLLWHHFNKELFQAVLQLENHLELRRDSQIWRRTHINVENVLHELKMVDDADLKNEIVQKICAVLDINTFEVRQPQRNRSGFNPGENLRGLYLSAAMMAHDCVANVHLAVDDEFVLYVHAAVDIPEGAPILFNYANVLQVGLLVVL